MRQNQYICIGFNAEGQRVFWDDMKNQMLEGNSNAIYMHKNRKQLWINCLVVCLLLLRTYMLDIQQLGAGICLVISGLEGVLFACVSRHYTDKLNVLFFEVAQPYEAKNKEEWTNMLKSGRKMVWTFIGVRLVMIFCAAVVAFLLTGIPEPFLLIFNVFIWWGLTYFFITISIIKMVIILRYLETNQDYAK